MKLDAFSGKKRFVTVGSTQVAYHEEGEGEPLVLLHGCPFSSFIWRKDHSAPFAEAPLPGAGPPRPR